MSNPWEIKTVEYDKTNAEGNVDVSGYGQISILLNKYVLKEKGKGLSSNDFTDNDKLKLSSIEVGAEKNKLETLTINGGTKIYPNDEKNINLPIPTKVSQLDNDLGYAKLINMSHDDDFSDSYVGKAKFAFQEEENLAIGKNAIANVRGVAIGADTSINEAYDVNINNELLHNVEENIWEGKITEADKAFKNDNGTNLTELDVVIEDLEKETQNRIKADSVLQDNINTEIQNRIDADNVLSQRVSSIEEIIPSQASTSNKLADKAFVNSTIQTNTANFRGNWNTWSDIPTDINLYPQDYAGGRTPTVNDYLVVKDASDYPSDTLAGEWRFKYTGVWSSNSKIGWIPEYRVNEEPFTSEQWFAINSGITSTKVSSYDSHVTNKNNPHSVTKSQVGLGSVVNTGDSATPVSGGTTKFTTGGAYTELNKKVDKVDGKGLSSNDFTNTYKDKLDNIVNTYATKSELSSWNIYNADYSGNPDDCEIGKWYSINTNSNSTNMPNNNGWATLITFAANNNDGYKQQLCFYTNSNTIYIRTSFNSVWNSWVSLSKSGHTHDYLPLSGGAMTGNIQYKGTKSVTNAIKFIDNTADTNGNGISIGGGGLTIIGGGESSDIVAAQQSSGGDEKMIVANDGAIDFYTHCQYGFNGAKHITMNEDGTVSADGFNGTATKASFLDEYPGAGSPRLTSLNIVPKDSSEYGGMRKDVVTDSVTDGSHPGQDGHLLTMFWDNSGRYDSQLFISNNAPLELKARIKANSADYGAWTDIATSDITGSLSSLNTTDKSNLVSAINEVQSGLGGWSGLTTDEMGIKWYSSNITSGRYKKPYYANGIWVIGGNAGIKYSTDGKTWSNSNVTSGSYHTPYYANGIWVIGGNAGIKYSTDGKTWSNSNVTSGSYHTPYYANGIWVIGGNNGIKYSTDGKTWTTSNITTTHYAPYYANGIWVIGGNNGIKYSTDGKTWTTSNITTTHYAPYYANGIWVIDSYSSGIKYSTDGKTWSNSNVTSGGYNNPYYANGIWVIGSHDSGIKYSTDGKTWTSSNITSSIYGAPYYANGIWVIGNVGNAGIKYSTDGKTWSNSNITNEAYNSPYYANGIWVIGSDTNLGIKYSTFNSLNDLGSAFKGISELKSYTDDTFATKSYVNNHKLFL